MATALTIPTIEKTEDRNDIGARVRWLRALQQSFASQIIASGILTTTIPAWTEIVSCVAEEDPVLDPLRQGLNRICVLAKAAGIDTRVAAPTPDDPNSREDVEDALITFAVPYADAGFWVGLVTGMQLGPNALFGVEATSTKKGGRR